MNFDIEHKLNRDTFNNFYNKEIIIYNHDYYLYLFNSQLQKIFTNIFIVFNIKLFIDVYEKI